MQNYSKSDSAPEKVAFATKLEDIVGGITLAAVDLTNDDIVPAGTAVAKDNTGLYHIVKTAKLYSDATNSATTYQVLKGSLFKVGDYVAAAVGAKAYAITAIDKTNTDYDVITVATTLGVAYTAANGVVLFQASAESTSTSSAYKYTASALTGSAVQIKTGDNHLVDAYLRATVYEVNVPPASAAIKAAMPQILFI